MPDGAGTGGYIELPDWLKPAGPPPPPPTASPPPRVEERRAERDASRNPPPLQLAFPEGRRVPVTGRTLLGRAPEPRAGEPSATLISTGDDRSVSKTHLLLEPAGADTLLVTDRGSTNGTSILAVDGTARRCDPESPSTARRGERIRLGDLEVALD